ncbi:MAG: molybdate ABC transporter substrate-binding protein [Beijerinckiaceae bacterium]|nr:molybdate ABC transporter substrate-binding protein [Beijerinckiaceae bacterium]
MTPRTLAFAIAVLASGPACAQQPVTVFAAASLKNALDEVGALFMKEGRGAVRFSYASSMTLARQLEQGAPAQAFCAADEESMDYAASRNAIQPGTRFNLLGNRLVVIAPMTSSLDKLDLNAQAITAALKGGRLAMGEVNSVPAGKYAKAALETLGAWSAVEKRAAYSENVRAAMMFVSRGEAPLGIAYATDAVADPKVKIVATLPENSHPPIVYPCAAGVQSNAGGVRFLEDLRKPSARTIFEKHGFTVL